MPIQGCCCTCFRGLQRLSCKAYPSMQLHLSCLLSIYHVYIFKIAFYCIVFILVHQHSIGNRQSHSTEVCVSMHIALCISLPLCQPVHCIFWPIRMLNWLVAARKLHNDRVTCCTAEWPYCPFPILWHQSMVCPMEGVVG